MDQARLELKRENAIAILNRLIAFLDDHELGGWSPRFREIVNALQQGDYRGAIAANKAIPRASMGSYGDFFVRGAGAESDAEADELFRKLSGAASSAIGNIRIYLDYEMDRALIDV